VARRQWAVCKVYLISRAVVVEVYSASYLHYSVRGEEEVSAPEDD
jgi:hypothetical protein